MITHAQFDACTTSLNDRYCAQVRNPAHPLNQKKKSPLIQSPPLKLIIPKCIAPGRKSNRLRYFFSQVVFGKLHIFVNIFGVPYIHHFREHFWRTIHSLRCLHDAAGSRGSTADLKSSFLDTGRTLTFCTVCYVRITQIHTNFGPFWSLQGLLTRMRHRRKQTRYQMPLRLESSVLQMRVCLHP